MILFFYNLALLAALVVGSPWWLWRVMTTAKYREGLWERLGFVRPLNGLDGRRVIWLHAVSVGEVIAVSGLVRELESALGDVYRVLISTTTRTGQALARERFGVARVFYCPLDLPWAVAAYLHALQPTMLVLAETEFWPNLLSGCYRLGIPVAVVNARVSDRSWPRYWRLRGLWRPFLSRLTMVMSQTETDAERMRALGCAAERVTVSGNLKFDVRVAAEAEATSLIRAKASETGGLRVVVAGSTLEGEEAMLLAAWAEVLAAHPRLVLVLAPRHPERFAAVASMLVRSGFAWRKRSAFGKTDLAAGEIVLLDSIGELASVYSLAAVAFVGGSLVPSGGHNPLEPAQFGVPIVMGPSYENFRAIVESLMAREAIRIVSREQLAESLKEMLLGGSAMMGERTRVVFEEQAGATGRTVAALHKILARGEV